MRSVKKLLIITLFLGMTLPVFAQDETQPADEAVSQAFTESAVVERHSPGILPGHRGRGHHRGPGANRGHSHHRVPPNPNPTPTPPPGCTFKFDPQGARALATGDVGMVMVTVLTGTDCPVDPVSASDFIHITGVGGQIVSFSVDPNTTNFVRSGVILISGQAYSVTQDGAFPNFDGTYNITYSFTVTFVGPPPGPPPVSGSGSFAATFVNGVLVNGGGVTVGTISDFGEVNIVTRAGGFNLTLTGSFDETGNGTGLMSAGGIPFVVVGGSWHGVRQ
jgi:hypothetical protein